MFCTGDILKDITYKQIEDSWRSDHHPVECRLNDNFKKYSRKTNRISNKKTVWEDYVKEMTENIKRFEDQEFARIQVKERYKDLVNSMRKAVGNATPGKQ